MCPCPYCAMNNKIVMTIEFNADEGFVICPICGSTHVHVEIHPEED
jgi:transcription elongation factor Elf1